MNIAEYQDLPGFDLVSKGLEDLSVGIIDSAEALLIAIGSPRLRSLGLDLPYQFPGLPEHALYFLLEETFGNSAHSQYNSWIRRLVSFERALAHRVKRTRGTDRLASHV
jgi:hypothetical protein